MTASTRLALASFLRGIAWSLFGVAGLAFWVGGRAISEFTRTDRILAEMMGLGLAAVTGALGFVAKTKADDLDADEDASTDR